MSTIEINSSNNTTVQIAVQESNTVNLAQPVNSVIEVVTLGPQGPIGPQGIQGIPGSLTSQTDLIITGSIWASGSNGHITASGNIISSGNIIASSFTGSLYGTSSFSLTSSIAITASYVLSSISSSLSSTASYIENAQTASYILNAISSSFTLTASYVQTAQTASYVFNSISSSFAITSSYIENAQTASYVLNSISSSFSSTASYALTASYIVNSSDLGKIINYQLAPSTQTLGLYSDGNSTGSFTNISASFIAPNNGKILIELSNLKLSSQTNFGTPTRTYYVGLSSTSGSFTVVKNYREVLSLPQGSSNASIGPFEVSPKWILTGLTPDQSYTYYFFCQQSGATLNTTQIFFSSVSDQTAVIMTSLP